MRNGITRSEKHKWTGAMCNGMTRNVDWENIIGEEGGDERGRRGGRGRGKVRMGGGAWRKGRTGGTEKEWWEGANPKQSSRHKNLTLECDV